MTKREPEDITNNEAEPEAIETMDPDSLKQALDAEKKKAEEYLV